MESKIFVPSIDFETFINREVDTVFNALTSSYTWDNWFTTGMVLEPVEGGVIHFKWENWGPHKYFGEDTGKILKLEKNKVFEFQWHGNSNIPDTIVTMTLSKMDEGTHLHLIETGYLDNPIGRGWMLSCASGWGEALTLLKMYLEHGITYTRRNL